MKNKIWTFAIALLAIPLIVGCNTIKGAGKDIERGGQVIQEQAK